MSKQHIKGAQKRHLAQAGGVRECFLEEEEEASELRVTKDIGVSRTQISVCRERGHGTCRKRPRSSTASAYRQRGR